MARTTGFPCVIVARMLAEKRFSEPGVFAPELLAQKYGLFDLMTDELRRRGVNIHAHSEEVSA
jgi:saccharopine dehydrogenase-like NADP-dependent oxidoreductase